MKNKFLLFLLTFVVVYTTYANNLSISNVAITGQNDALNFKLINFDITWENSWNINGGPQNWDAAWVFVKYRDKTETTWHHATLNWINGTGSGDGHTEPANCNISSSNDTGSGGAHGVFIHRTDLGQGTVNFVGVQLRWNYGIDGLGDGDNVELCVMGIEMVYVPQGSFYVGSGGIETNAFYTHPTTTNPYFISSETTITVGTTAGNLYYGGISGDHGSPIPAAFPKGYNAFYCMKYEITQSQYVAFLNKLTYDQQVTRTEQLPINVDVYAMYSGSSGGTPQNRNGIYIEVPGNPAVYSCNLAYDGLSNQPNDGQSIACNWLSWKDVAAYLDWSALRPISEFEYEKAGRGSQYPVPDEYAWGTTALTGATSIINSGSNNEIAQAGANCVCNFFPDGGQGPMRSGTFGQAATTRVQAGASYYGIMELSGNLSECIVSIGVASRRLYTPINGNGVLSTIGEANTSTWPLEGIGYKGGSYFDDFISKRLSDRESADGLVTSRLPSVGGRGCRKAP